jgi:hypothetical protein
MQRGLVKVRKGMTIEWHIWAHRNDARQFESYENLKIN